MYLVLRQRHIGGAYVCGGSVDETGREETVSVWVSEGNTLVGQQNKKYGAVV